MMKNLVANARLAAEEAGPLLKGGPHEHLARLVEDLANAVEQLSALEASWEQSRIALATMGNEHGAMRVRAEAAEAKVRDLKNRLAGAFAFEAPAALAAIRLLDISERFPLGSEHIIEHDGFRGRVVGYYRTEEGKPGVALQINNARVVHVYGTKWLGDGHG